MDAETNRAPRQARSNRLLALVRLVRLTWIAVRCATAMAVIHKRESDPARRYECIRDRMFRDFVRIRRALGFGIRVTGLAPPDGALLAPNHTGYGDILALGGCLPCFFVPKAEITHWPLIGALVRLSGHVSSSRKMARNLRATADAVSRRLAMGHNVVVFLEGTSTGGDRVLPFRSALVQAAIDAAAPVVPVGLRWSSADPDVDPSEDIAYWKDHTFAPHFWRFLGLRGIEVEVSFGAARAPQAGADRKALAQDLHDCVETVCLQLPPTEGLDYSHCARNPRPVLL